MPSTTSIDFFIHTFEGKFTKTFYADFLYKSMYFETLLPQNAPTVLKIEFDLQNEKKCMYIHTKEMVI